jgi:hypothetical protein
MFDAKLWKCFFGKEKFTFQAGHRKKSIDRIDNILEMLG